VPAARRSALFHAAFLEDLRFWIGTDRACALRVLDLVDAALREPFTGIGKPEPLRHQYAGCWSRRVSLERLIEALGKRGILSVMIEGGAEINASALREGIVDKVLVFLAPTLIGGKSTPTAVGGDGIESLSQAVRLRDVRIERFDGDILVEGYIQRMMGTP